MDLKKMSEEQLRDATIRNLLKMDKQSLMLMKSNAEALCLYREMKEQQQKEDKQPA